MATYDLATGKERNFRFTYSYVRSSVRHAMRTYTYVRPSVEADAIRNQSERAGESHGETGGEQQRQQARGIHYVRTTKLAYLAKTSRAIAIANWNTTI